MTISKKLLITALFLGGIQSIIQAMNTPEFKTEIIDIQNFTKTLKSDSDSPEGVFLNWYKTFEENKIYSCFILNKTEYQDILIRMANIVNNTEDQIEQKIAKLLNVAMQERQLVIETKNEDIKYRKQHSKSDRIFALFTGLIAGSIGCYVITH